MTYTVSMSTADWTEPTISPLERRQRMTLAMGSIGLCALLLTLASWQREVSFGIGAAVALAASVALFAPSQFSAKPRSVQVSKDTLIINDRSWETALLAGFWLKADSDYTLVTFEHKKPLAFPLTALFPGTPDEAAALLQPYLAELEPRSTTGIDRFTRFLKF
jgi:peptidoglycan/LPS O-acetylase OafA/YrhL